MSKTIFLLGLLFLLLLPKTVIANKKQDCITIDLQPQDQLILDNDDVVFRIEASSTENLAYQWQIFDLVNGWTDLVDGGDYSGSNTSLLTITNVNEDAPIDNTLIRVLVSTPTGTCSQVISREARIDFIAIRVFNKFTPNGDGINDLFVIGGILLFPESVLKIYNRWGNLIYDKKGYQNDWDGIATSSATVIGSKHVPSGTYFYTLNLNFDNKKFSGWIYINR